MRKVPAALVVLVAVVMLYPLGHGRTSGTIKGILRTTEGLSVAGASFRLSHEAGLCTRETISEGGGKYAFAGLPTGEYRLSVKMPGYQSLELEAISVRDNVVELELELVPMGGPDYPPRILFSGSVRAPLDEADSKAKRHDAPSPPALPFPLLFRQGNYTVYSLAKLLNEPEIYHDLVVRPAAEPPGRPDVTLVRPYQCQGPVNMVESGTLVEIRGRNLDSATQIVVDGRSSLPLLTSRDFMVGRIEGVGSCSLRIVNAWGILSDPIMIALIRIVPERVPPDPLKPGESARIVLRIEGSADPVSASFAASSPSIAFRTGGGTVEATSSGGEPNIMVLDCVAREAGPYEISYRLANLIEP